MRVSPLLLDIMIAQHRFDFWHELGGIGDLHDQPSSLPWRPPTGILCSSIIISHVWIQLRGILEPSWVGAEFQAQHRPARLNVGGS